MVFFYGRCLTRVYAFEQETKQKAQGEYYFLRRLGIGSFFEEDRYLAMEDRRQKEEGSRRPAPGDL